MKSKSSKFYYILVIILCSLNIFGVVGISNSYSLFYSYMSDAWQVPRVSATLHVTISSLVSGFATPMIARASRKIKLKRIFLFGLVLNLAAGIAMANTNNVNIINVLSAFKGIATSCLNMIFITTVINNWFISKRGTVIGIVLSASGIGGAVMSPVLQSLIDHFGFKTSFLICYILTAILCLPFALFCPVSPSDVGMEPYQTENDVAVKKTETHTSIPFNPRSSFFVTLVLVSASVTALLNIVSHLPSFALEQGYSSSIGATQLSFVMIGNIVFKLLMGLLIDKFDIYISYSTVVGISAIGSLLILNNQTNPTLYVLSGILYGACYSATTVGMPNLFSKFYSDNAYMEAYSTSTLITSLYSSAIFTMVNLVYDLTNSYSLPFYSLIVLGLLGIIFIHIIKRKSKTLSSIKN